MGWDSKRDSHIRGKNAMNIRDQGLRTKNSVIAGVTTTIPATNVVSTTCKLRIPYTLRMKPHRSSFSSAGIPGYKAAVFPYPVSRSPYTGFLSYHAIATQNKTLTTEEFRTTRFALKTPTRLLVEIPKPQFGKKNCVIVERNSQRGE